jgi:antitoxin (DNA-binding transcriptional repressor) of toxin-antitoxin stability system
MAHFTIGEAKTHLSKLVALAERGEEVELRRGATPVARLVPIVAAGKGRRPGALAGKIELAEVRRLAGGRRRRARHL